MKQFFTLLLFLFVVSISAQDKTFKDFYKSHKKTADVSLNVPGFIARWFVEDNDDEEINELLAKARNYKIMVFDNNSTSIQKDLKKFVKANNLKTLVKVKDRKDRISIHFKEDKNLIREIIVNVYSEDDDESVLLGLRTKLTKKEFASVVKPMKAKVASK